MPVSLNIERLEAVADALGERLTETAFVGGAVVELYVEDPAAPAVRNTADVDCVVPVTGATGLRQWEEELRARGFRNDMRQGAPICRWVCGDVVVDFMPTDGDVLGFTNPWYASGLENTVPYTLPSGRTIRLFALPWYVATKMAAVTGRGGDDLRFSHDFEDVIYLWDCVPDFRHRLEMAPGPLRAWLASELAKWRGRAEWREAVECCVDQGSPRRVARILEEAVALMASNEAWV